MVVAINQGGGLGRVQGFEKPVSEEDCLWDPENKNHCLDLNSIIPQVLEKASAAAGKRLCLLSLKSASETTPISVGSTLYVSYEVKESAEDRFRCVAIVSVNDKPVNALTLTLVSAKHSNLES